MAFRLDLLNWNIAGLGNDAGHGVKGRTHQQIPVPPAVFARTPTCLHAQVETRRAGLLRPPHAARRIAKRGRKFNGTRWAANVSGGQVLLLRIHVVATSVATTTRKITRRTSPARSQ